MQIVKLGLGRYGVYSNTRRGPFKTPLVFAGTLTACLSYRAAAQERG